jgi:hypothetical protein
MPHAYKNTYGILPLRVIEEKLILKFTGQGKGNGSIFFKN